MRIREKVCEVYSAAAETPEGKHPFPVGEGFARSVGYPEETLRWVPKDAKGAFAGVSNVSVFAEIEPGSSILDLGCGAGLDSLVAAARTGSRGAVIAVDFSDAMLARARSAASLAGLANIEFRRGDAESLPLDNASIDSVIFNGIFNLNPERGAIFKELARVTKPGGTVFGAELVLLEPLADEQARDESNWFA